MRQLRTNDELKSHILANRIVYKSLNGVVMEPNNLSIDEFFLSLNIEGQEVFNDDLSMNGELCTASTVTLLNGMAVDLEMICNEVIMDGVDTHTFRNIDVAIQHINNVEKLLVRLRGELGDYRD